MSNDKSTCEVKYPNALEYAKFIDSLKGADIQSPPLYRLLAVKAAIENGLLIEPKLTAEDADGADPRMIKRISRELTAMIEEVESLDPLS